MKSPIGSLLFFAALLPSLVSLQGCPTTCSGNPPARSAMGMAFDAATQSTVLFGGLNGGGVYLNDTWVLGESGWVQQFPATSPSPRQGAGMAYDAATGTTVLFGGFNGTADLNDTWIWDGKTWTKLFPPLSPPARRFDTQGMAYDAATHAVVLFGGITRAFVPFRDTWVWHGTTRTWTRQFPAVSPSARRAPLAYDAASQTVVLFGGDNPQLKVAFNDTWTWNGTNWTRHFPVTAPAARAMASMAYDAATSSVLLFGGLPIVAGTYSYQNTFNDTWAWNGDTWTKKSPSTVPPNRYSAGMDYDAPDQRVVLYGGFSSGPARCDTWTWNGSNWASGGPQ